LVDTLFLQGVTSTKGLGLGRAVVLITKFDLDTVPDKTATDHEAETTRLRQAIAAELSEIRRLGERMQDLLSAADRALFDAHALLLGSESLMNGMLQRIHEGNWAPGALRATLLEYTQRFETMDDPYLKERAADIRDLGQRLLRRLLHQQSELEKPLSYPNHTVLVGKEIGLSEFLAVPPEKLTGLVTVRGTALSHVALLARGLGIPAVFGVSDLPLRHLQGSEVMVDGYSARVCICPSPVLRQEYLKLLAEEAELTRGLQELRHLPAVTPDGYHLALYANASLLAEIAAARDGSAEGIGLYRSELYFCLHELFPSEEEQTTTYTRLLQVMAPRPVVLRTLDVGGDKSLKYFPVEEQNSFMGWRGIRLSLDHPEIFKTQLRAMLRAGAVYPNLAILFPMITCVHELNEALGMLREVHAELRKAGLAVPFPRVGLTVEVPATVYQIDTLARRVDFVSIGSNDLTQYLLAVDRNNERVAKLYDELHPAVLQAIQHSVERAHLAKRPVSICGEMAGDPAAALMLMAMGVDGLSMRLGNLLKIKWVIRTFTRRHARKLLAEVLRMDDSDTVRERLNSVLTEYGLGGLIRVA
jgi:phosphotransferase system enzyme I (PtsP)